MQHRNDATEELISIAAAARLIGVNRSTLQRQVKSGQVRAHNGKIRLSDALANRAANLDPAKVRRRTGSVASSHFGVASAVASAQPGATRDADATATFNAGVLWGVQEFARRIAGASVLAALEAGCSAEVGKRMEPIAGGVAVEIGHDVLVRAGLFTNEDDPEIWGLPETFSRIDWTIADEDCA